MRTSTAIFLIAGAIVLLVLSEFTNGGSLGYKCIGKKGESKITESFNLETINSISAFGEIDVIISEGRKQKLEITTTPTIMAQLKKDSKVKDNDWKVGVKKCVKAPILLEATIKNLSALSISGSGSIETGSKFNNIKNLDLSISGSGDMNLDLGNNINEINSSVSGSGEFVLTGSTEIHNISISGSGDMMAADLITKTSKVKIAGSGGIKIHSEELLDVSIAGSGDICYTGNPKIMRRVAGSGDINDCNSY